jgi:type I restriction enzyme S subunit
MLLELQALAESRSGTFPQITFSELALFEINLPNLATQDKIVAMIDCFDNKIAINNRINHNLEEQAQALYKSWFVDFEPFKGGKFVDSELGMIPEGWRVLPFLSIARLCSGGTPKTDQKEFWNGSIPFFTPKDVGDSAFCLSTEKTITEEGLMNCNSSLYKAFTTFLTARGTVGKLCMAGVPMAMNQTNYAICPASNIDVITLFLITKQLINSLRNKANGAVFDAITTRDFDGEKVTIAPQGVMDTFSSVVHPIYESILQNEMKNASLSQLRDSLLPKLMSGDFITSDIPC